MKYQTIPRARIGALIGKDGETKESIEKTAGVKLTIDSESGEVIIEDSNADAINSLKAEEIIKAIGRGFSPKRAFRLWDDDAIFEVIDLKDYYGKKENRIRIARGRIIGTEGKARKTIEDFTGTYRCFCRVVSIPQYTNFWQKKEGKLSSVHLIPIKVYL